MHLSAVALNSLKLCVHTYVTAVRSSAIMGKKKHTSTSVYSIINVASCRTSKAPIHTLRVYKTTPKTLTVYHFDRYTTELTPWYNTLMLTHYRTSSNLQSSSIVTIELWCRCHNHTLCRSSSSYILVNIPSEFS